MVGRRRSEKTHINKPKSNPSSDDVSNDESDGKNGTMKIKNYENSNIYVPRRNFRSHPPYPVPNSREQLATPTNINCRRHFYQRRNKIGLDYLKEAAELNKYVYRKKTALEYLCELAKEEVIKMQIQHVYEKQINSENFNQKNAKLIGGDINQTDIMQNKLNRDDPEIHLPYVVPPKRRSYKKIENIEKILPENETIQSFTDFPDDLFTTKVRNGVTVFCCADDDCDMELPSLTRIKRHYLVHTNLKPFKCLNKHCNKRYSRRDNMLHHYKSHCKHNRN
ncbi:zinc finger C2H2 domain-containing protein [Vairimorpha necatrix]|uniref:Zinc finger C2H2 domain-containing protein n=1 Tax=Vairimorpha necatrix TaxID=6039 RepID=A0AAX4JC44_9MICR